MIQAYSGNVGYASVNSYSTAKKLDNGSKSAVKSVQDIRADALKSNYEQDRTTKIDRIKSQIADGKYEMIDAKTMAKSIVDSEF